MSTKAVNEIGCFGKIPAHGDFVWQGLPADFVTPWDNWLQSQLLNLREARQDDWLDIYLQSNIWRFVLRDSRLGSGTWAGVITPSVDMVGRYFPFTIASNVAHHSSVVTSISKLDQWFTSTETLLLDSMQTSSPIDDLMEQVRTVSIPLLAERNIEGTDSSSIDQLWHARNVDSEPWAAVMLESLVYRQFEEPCVWETLDREGVREVQITEGAQGFTRLFY
ncbi:MAG: type VI secretion system-associated protein TagF [Pseudomonadota bacterium]